MALYGVTAIGHQAVVVFFVLSGYWVGGSLLRKARQGRFSWPSYLADRTTRLWVVLVPALVLTLALDAIGRRYFGAMTACVGDPRYGGVALDQRPIDGLTFFGNVFFMGGIRVPTFGSITALWSLGFEFWMYVIAAIILLSFFVLRSSFAGAAGSFSSSSRLAQRFSSVIAFSSTSQFGSSELWSPRALPASIHGPTASIRGPCSPCV